MCGVRGVERGLADDAHLLDAAEEDVDQVNRARLEWCCSSLYQPKKGASQPGARSSAAKQSG
jgi:hypothetical protein